MSEFNNMEPWNKMRRCVLNPDGSMVGYLDGANSDKWEDGDSVNWATVESSGQNVMVEIPKFYHVKKTIGGKMSFGVSDMPVETSKLVADDWKVSPAFFRDRLKPCDDQTGIAIEVDNRYYGAFMGWVDGQNRLRSLPNKQPTASKIIGAFRTHAKNNGNGWGQVDFNLLTAIQMLYITEYGHPDSQTTIGRGYVDGNSSVIATGATMQYGNSSFGETTGKKQMSYRGIEDFYGNAYYWVDGFFNDASRNMLIGNKGFNDTGAGYKNLGQGSTANLNGNVRTIQESDESGFVVKTTNGTSAYTSGLYDRGYLYSDCLPRFGGSWAIASKAGAFALRVSFSSSDSYSNIGARLVF